MLFLIELKKHKPVFRIRSQIFLVTAALQLSKANLSHMSRHGSSLHVLQWENKDVLFTDNGDCAFLRFLSRMLLLR